MSINDGLGSWASNNRSLHFILRNGDGVETDTLNALVTGAIWRAEQLEAEGLRSASQAWAEVSSLEEELARLFSVSDSDVRIPPPVALRAPLNPPHYPPPYPPPAH